MAENLHLIQFIFQTSLVTLKFPFHEVYIMDRYFLKIVDPICLPKKRAFLV